MTKRIILKSLTDICNVVTIASKYKQSVSISCGWLTANAKSILGMYSLQLGKPLDITIDGEIDESQFEKDFKPYFVRVTA